MASRPAIRRLPRAISVVAALTGLLTGSLARSAAADPLDPAPGADLAAPSDAQPAGEARLGPRADSYPPPSARTNLLLAGAASTAAWYGLALASSFAWPDTVGAKDLRIPIAGPWMALGETGCGNVSDCSKVLVVLRAIATTIDGIGQAGGLAIAAEGLFLPTQERRDRKRAAAERRHTIQPSASFSWRPTFVDAGKNSVGVGVLGVF